VCIFSIYFKNMTKENERGQGESIKGVSVDWANITDQQLLEFAQFQHRSNRADSRRKAGNALVEGEMVRWTPEIRAFFAHSGEMPPEMRATFDAYLAHEKAVDEYVAENFDALSARLLYEETPPQRKDKVAMKLGVEMSVFTDPNLAEAMKRPDIVNRIKEKQKDMDTAREALRAEKHSATVALDMMPVAENYAAKDETFRRALLAKAEALVAALKKQG
jgi:hypothetical protein